MRSLLAGSMVLFALGCSPSTPTTDAPEVKVEPPPPGGESAAPTATVAPTAAPTPTPAPTETATPPVPSGEAGPKPPPTGFPFGKPDAGGQVVAGTDACKSDADCVAATCCHPSTCTARGKAPKCDAVMCTRECRGGTMDCGGGCLCQGGKCAARLMP